MKVSKDLRDFPLHDGGIDLVLYLPESKSLIIDVNLPEESTIGYFGRLTFHNVKLLEVDPPLEQIIWNEIGTNISTADYMPEDNEEGLEACSWQVTITYWERKSGDFFLTFLSESFDWQPDLSKPSPYL